MNPLVLVILNIVFTMEVVHVIQCTNPLIFVLNMHDSITKHSMEHCIICTVDIMLT